MKIHYRKPTARMFQDWTPEEDALLGDEAGCPDCATPEVCQHDGGAAALEAQKFPPMFRTGRRRRMPS